MKKINKSHKINSNHPNGNAPLCGAFCPTRQRNDKLPTEGGNRCEGDSRTWHESDGHPETLCDRGPLPGELQVPEGGSPLSSLSPFWGMTLFSSWGDRGAGGPRSGKHQDVGPGSQKASWALRGSPRHLRTVLLPFPSPRPSAQADPPPPSFPAGPLPPDTHFPVRSPERYALPFHPLPAHIAS